jgi:nitroreductase
MKNPVVSGLLWRAALKSFHPVPPPSVDVQPILDAIQLAPSAFGVQPYDIHVITDPDVKAQLRNASYNQPQVTDCSHLLVFCAHTHAAHSVQRFVDACRIEDDAPDFASFLHRTYDSQPVSQYLPWASNQAYLALGVGVTAAADLRVGSCPMSGFVAADVARVLQLPTITDYLMQQGKAQSQSQATVAADGTAATPSTTPTAATATATAPSPSPETYLSWPVAYLAIGSTLDDAAWHAESRKVYKRRRVPLQRLFHWHGPRTIRETQGAVEKHDQAAAQGVDSPADAAQS